MDRGEVERSIAEQVILYDIDAVAKGLSVEAITRRTQELHAAYIECRDGFADIIDLVKGDSTPGNRTPYSDIVLERNVEYAGVGRGNVTAGVFRGLGRSFGTTINFVAESGVVTSSIPEYFGAFPLAGHIETKPESPVYVGRHIHAAAQTLKQTARRGWPDILKARQTQAMIWEAMRNPELNPEIAARIVEREAAARPIN